MSQQAFGIIHLGYNFGTGTNRLGEIHSELCEYKLLTISNCLGQEANAVQYMQRTQYLFSMRTVGESDDRESRRESKMGTVNGYVGRMLWNAC